MPSQWRAELPSPPPGSGRETGIAPSVLGEFLTTGNLQDRQLFLKNSVLSGEPVDKWIKQCGMQCRPRGLSLQANVWRELLWLN